MYLKCVYENTICVSIVGTISGDILTHLSASYFEMRLKIDSEDRLRTKL